MSDDESHQQETEPGVSTAASDLREVRIHLPDGPPFLNPGAAGVLLRILLVTDAAAAVRANRGRPSGRLAPDDEATEPIAPQRSSDSAEPVPDATMSPTDHQGDDQR